MPEIKDFLAEAKDVTFDEATNPNALEMEMLKESPTNQVINYKQGRLSIMYQCLQASWHPSFSSCINYLPSIMTVNGNVDNRRREDAKEASHYRMQAEEQEKKKGFLAKLGL